MDNYLSYRWPEGAPEGWSPERREPPHPKKKRRLLRSLLVCLLLLAVLAGLLAGGWFLAGAVLERWVSELPAPQSSREIPPVETDRLEQEPVLSVPRAETGLGVTLELDTAEREALPAQEIYDQVLPSVVSIAARMEGKAGYSAGSGVIMREDGYVLTNYHVIEDSSAVTVMLLSDSSTYEAKLVGYDGELDLAILKIEAEGLTAARFGDSDDLRVGDPAYAIGNPMGYLYGTMTDGIISGLERSQEVGGYDMTLIQTTAALNSGNSGGALVNQYGQVVGITVAKISGTENSALVEGLGLAIPISDVRPFINHILDTGETWRPTIGITCYAVEADGMAGIMVATVEQGTPAFEAGLSEMDLIIAANGTPVDSLYALKRVLNETGVGGTLTCTVLRGGEQIELTFALIDSSELDQ